MISTKGIYDAHVHAALDISLKRMKKENNLCGAILDVGANLGRLLYMLGALRLPIYLLNSTARVQTPNVHQGICFLT